MSAALGPIHEYQIDQPSICSPASLSRSTNYKGHKGNPIISVDRSLHISEVITRRQLPQETRKIVRALHNLSPGWNWVILLPLGIWLVCAYIAVSVEILILDLLLYTVASVSLTSLSVLCHEASHNLFTRRSSRDAWLKALCGLPILFSSAGYRVMHRYHHKYLRTELDPDDPENITNHPRLMPFLFMHHLFPGIKVHKALSGTYERTGASVYPTYRSFYRDFFMAMRQEYVSGRRLVPADIREHICV